MSERDILTEIIATNDNGLSVLKTKKKDDKKFSKISFASMFVSVSLNPNFLLSALIRKFRYFAI